MKKLIFIVGIIGIIAGINKAEAQPIPQFSQYMFNGIYINPAYAGYKDVLYGHLMYRKQWVGINGSPQTTLFSIDGSLSKGSNVGLVYANDKIGAASTNSIMVDYAYRFKVSENGRLSFGLSGGMIHHGVDKNKLLNENGSLDPSIAAVDNVWKPGIDAGIYFDTKNFYAGFSIVGVLSNKKLDNTMQVIRTDANYYLTAGGRIPLTGKLALHPSTLLKSDFKNPLNIDLNAILWIADKFGIGGSYRTGILWFTDVKDNTRQKDAIALIGEAYVSDRIRIGFAYDFDLNRMTTGTNGGFEISVGYYLTKAKNKYVTPRYF
jgi:type IX secretion system PorP/SprF family membrane protein